VMTRPIVSVIIPTYNRAQIIGDTIENIFQQTYKNIELIIVDDGSTDETQSVLRSYGDNIRWTSQKNAGPAAARNRGIAMATGEIVAFQDSDDTWDPTKLERQVSLLRRAESAVCCICNAVVEHTDFHVIAFDNAPVKPAIEEGLWTNPAEVLATRFLLFNQTVAIRKSALDRVGGFDESLRILEDHDLALRLAMGGPWAFIRKPLATRQARVERTERTLSGESTPLIVAENTVRSLESAARTAEASDQSKFLRSLIGRELKRARRRARAIRLKNRHGIVPAAIGRTLEGIEDYRNALYRRMPWYPAMEVLGLKPEERDQNHKLPAEEGVCRAS
jgi:glycosyltransferase involved in cell wall biosynthesis